MKEFFNSFIGGAILLAGLIGMGTLYCYVLFDFVRFLIKTENRAWIIAPVLVLFFSFGLSLIDHRYLIFVFMTMVVFGAPLTLRLANSKNNSKQYNASLIGCCVVGLILTTYFGVRLITTGK